MKNKILLFIILFISLTILPSLAQTESLWEQDDIDARDPFASWLPKIEEKIEKIQEEAKIDISAPEGSIIPEMEVKKPEPVVEVKPPEIIISGLVWSTDKPQAIINNQVLMIGDMIGDSQITDITKEGIDIIFFNKRYTIPIERTITQSI